MIKVRNLGLLLALSSVAALPACSMFGGGSSRSQSSSAGYPSQSYASAQQPNYSSTPPMQQSTEQQPLTSDTIRGVQQTLQQDGLYHSRVDGVWGPSSQSALRQYQQQHNMNPTGQLDQQTLAALNQGSDNGQNYGGSNQSYNNGGMSSMGSNNPNTQGAQPMTGPATQNQSTQNAQSNQQSGSTTR